MGREILLFVGIGNVGDKYFRTRHNVGFWLVDELSRLFGVLTSSYSKKFNSDYSKCIYGNKTIYIIKPRTFVNLSGIAVQFWKSFYKLSNSEVFVFYDDISVPLGKIKIVNSGSSGGHNGIKSITNCIGSGYTQVKFGLKPSIINVGDKNTNNNSGFGSVADNNNAVIVENAKKMDISKFVLGKLCEAEIEVLQQKISTILLNIDLLLTGTNNDKSLLIDMVNNS
ncbi:MAG: peptidyl-tRNA hydrolase [Alphaproteobacteria bacterium]|nr:peptidyl-tRNA hydrolase [Rickettsiales bacterium]